MKFLIVDDHAVVREGLAAVLQQASARVVVLQAANGEAALALAGEHADLDIVFLDLMMPDVDGMALLADFSARYSGLPVIILSASELPDDVRRALASGALGYVPKSANAATLLAALKLVLAGEIYVPPFVVSAGRPSGSSGDQPRAFALTTRQADVLSMIGAEFANKEIAYQLGISEKTVKAHVTAIFRALGVSNRAQAARIARDETGL